MPRWRNAQAAAKPPIPAPMIAIRSGRFASFRVIDVPDVRVCGAAGGQRTLVNRSRII
jgi:hypothetical protein